MLDLNYKHMHLTITSDNQQYIMYLSLIVYVLNNHVYLITRAMV